MVTPSLHLNWHNPVDIRLGVGLMSSLKPVQPFVLLVDPGVVDTSTQAQWMRRWGHLCLGWVWQTQTISSLQAARELALDLWPTMQSMPDCALWAIGGGTTLDLAKLLRWRFDDLADASADWRDNTLRTKPHRHALWCSPSTAGTGSEVTPWATVWDLEDPVPRKRSWSVAHGFAEKAWIDPLLTLSCPPHVTRNTGLDALAHALESLWNRKANRLSRPIAVQAAQTILDVLPQLMREPQSIASRTRMAQASLLAGLAMSQTQTALSHALSYELTLHENMPHGQACAIWLPMTMDMATQHSAQVRHDLESVFRQPIAQCLLQLRQWLEALGITCRDLRDSPEGISTLQQALASDRGRNFIEASFV